MYGPAGQKSPFPHLAACLKSGLAIIKAYCRAGAGSSSEMLRCLLVVNIALWKDMRRLKGIW